MKKQRLAKEESWPETKGDPHHYLMIPHDEAPSCAAYLEARELRQNAKRPEWKLFWTNPRAWYHTAVGVRLIPAELLELVTIAEMGQCLSRQHLDALHELAALAIALERHASQPQPETLVQLAPIRAACEALLDVLSAPPPHLGKRFGKALPKHHDLVGKTANTSPFGWLAQATEDLKQHAACSETGRLIYFEIMLG